MDDDKGCLYKNSTLWKMLEGVTTITFPFFYPNSFAKILLTSNGSMNFEVSLWRLAGI